jgi:hypothetical protein
MDLKDILRNGELHELLIDTETSADKRESMVSICKANADSLDSPEFFLPVLGVQGSGKSTLLNAICFDDPVLPIDADETTAVPVEIRRRGSEDPEARVYFKDGREKPLTINQDNLNLYVHQEQNPGNRLGVTKLSVESDAPFLANGIVLVDLPGMGSLTKANWKTTVDYINGASGLICIIRTNPTVTASEAKDIKTHWWSKRYNTFFVQSIWNDEGKEDVKEGVSFNQGVIDRIAKELRIETEVGNQFKIIPINAYGALKARLKGNKSPNMMFGPEELTTLLARLSDRWKSELHENSKLTLLGFIDFSITELSNKSDALSADKATAERSIEEAHAKKMAIIDSFKRQSNMAEEKLYNLKKDIGNICSKWKSEEGENLRNEMRMLAHKGITDGSRLNTAFSDHTKKAYSVLTEMIQERLLVFQDVMESMFAKTADVSIVNKSFNGAGGEFKGEEGIRLRDHMGKLGGGVGAIAPLAVGAAAIPISWPIIAVAGVIGAILGNFLGGKAKKSLADGQLDKILDQIPKLVDEFLASSAGSVTESTAQYCKGYEIWFADQCRLLEDDARRQHDSDLADRRQSADNMQAAREKVEERIAKLKDFKAMAESITA